ncbi:MAG: redoxin domain-containing protein, partial [Dehalococcoidales bacterium]|nr:redoxin domain-containing protein [Dehalococcoidales bacterium]
QMLSLEANHQVFERLNAVALGIGVDSVPSNRAWAQAMEIKNTRLLSDFWPHGEVARKYGLFREEDGFSERANVVLDEDQKVVFVKVYPTTQLPDIQEIIRVLEG